MRGDLTEALDRLARRDEALRRRDAQEDPRSAAEDLVAAARKLVDRHPELTVTVTVESGPSRSSVRLAHGEPPRVVDSPYYETSYHDTRYQDTPYQDVQYQDAPTAGVRPLDLGPDEVVVLDRRPGSPHEPPSAAARLAELLRENPPDA
ncbi:MAG TPA: hypothetical protein VJT31_22020 [Rugosimonospora sp.]|nr:hypothetical protein [Rugosimonospora sp.]